MAETFAKRDRTARLLRVVNLLYQYGERGATPREIADKVEMTVRTVYRDLCAIRDELSIPVWSEDGRWGVEQTYFLPPLHLTRDEAITLFLAARLTDRFQDYHDRHVQAAFEKLAAVLPQPVASHVAATVASMAGRPRDWQREQHADALFAAWATGRKVRIWYPHTSRSGRTYVNERVVCPYFIEPNPSGHTRYLIGHDSYTGQVRTFRVERIQRVEPTAERFEIPDTFDAAERLRHAWGVADQDLVEVHLRFHDAAAAERARQTRWHPSQQATPNPDGTLDLRFEVGGLLEITPWVLTWGGTVEVLAPRDLRERVAEAARQMLARNGPGDLAAAAADRREVVSAPA